MVGRNRRDRAETGAEVVGLIFEREAAALRVVERDTRCVVIVEFNTS